MKIISSILALNELEQIVTIWLRQETLWNWFQLSPVARTKWPLNFFFFREIWPFSFLLFNQSFFENCFNLFCLSAPADKVPSLQSLEPLQAKKPSQGFSCLSHTVLSPPSPEAKSATDTEGEYLKSTDSCFYNFQKFINYFNIMLYLFTYFFMMMECWILISFLINIFLL